MHKRLLTLLTFLTMTVGLTWGHLPPSNGAEAADKYKTLIADDDSLYWSLRTNLLYDALLVPNLSAELYVGMGWSLGVGYWHTWLNSDASHRYWRTYGGELNLRKYLGARASRKPLSGHHLGMLAQAMSYDFEFGGKGNLSEFSYSVGLEYGYSVPIGRRLSLDLGVAVGYLGGEYKEYRPIDTHYVWQSTRNRHWFGPIKAEATLVWQLGKTNINKKKGGIR